MLQNSIPQDCNDLFSILYDFSKISLNDCQYIGGIEMKEDNIVFYQALEPVVRNYIELYQSIICLTENGFTNCAMDLWRSFFEHSIIINFIIENGVNVAEAYVKNFQEASNSDHNHICNYDWALAAQCFDGQEEITFKMIYDKTSIRWNLIKLGELYNMLTSQLVNGAAAGITMEFKGVATPITATIPLLYETMRKFTALFDDKETKKYLRKWDALIKKYCDEIALYMEQDTLIKPIHAK